MFKKSALLIIAIISIVATTTAQADPKNGKQKRSRAPAAQVVCNDFSCPNSYSANDYSESYSEPQRAVATRGNGTVVGRRPNGCPHAYCGCEASLYLFGEIRPELNLAANWMRKFPRTSPAAGMVAARNHHVMVLMSHVGGNDWLVHDGNSGGGLTREHVRSISGYVIVDPRGSRFAER